MLGSGQRELASLDFQGPIEARALQINFKKVLTTVLLSCKVLPVVAVLGVCKKFPLVQIGELKMRKYTMTVTKNEAIEGTEKNRQVPVGTVDIYYPLLEELGFKDAKPSEWEAEGKDGKMIPSTEADPQAFPIYAEEGYDFAFSACWAAVKAKARNCLQSGTNLCKEGLSIAETLEDLFKSGERSGEALKIKSEAIKSFKAYLASTGKSQAYQFQVANWITKAKDILPLLPESHKKAALSHVEAWGKTLDAATVERFGRFIQAISDAAEQVVAFDEMS